MELGQIVLCRSLYMEAEAHLSRNGAVHAGLAVSIAQDAVELFLRAIIKSNPQPNSKVPEEFAKCMDYIDTLAGSDDDRRVPFRARMNELNKARVNFKHYGLVPDRADVRRLLSYAQDFFETATPRFFSKEFSAVSMADMVLLPEAQKRLKRAEECLMTDGWGRALGYSAEAVDWVTNQLLFSASQRVLLAPPSLGTVANEFTGMLKEIENYVHHLNAGSRRLSLMLALSVNIDELVRFESIVPFVRRRTSGEYIWESSHISEPGSREDAEFAVSFATRFAIEVQGRMSGADQRRR